MAAFKRNPSQIWLTEHDSLRKHAWKWCAFRLGEHNNANRTGDKTRCEELI